MSLNFCQKGQANPFLGRWKHFKAYNPFKRRHETPRHNNTFNPNTHQFNLNLILIKIKKERMKFTMIGWIHISPKSLQDISAFPFSLLNPWTNTAQPSPHIDLKWTYGHQPKITFCFKWPYFGLKHVWMIQYT